MPKLGETEIERRAYGGKNNVSPSQYKTAYGTYLGDYGSPRNPGFFDKDFDELLATVRQRNKAAYGGTSTAIRESLANAGLLGSGALPEALAGAQISMGQQIAGDISSLYGMEFNNKRGFDIRRALELLQGDFTKAQQDDAQQFELLNSFLGILPGVGSFFGGKIPGLFGGKTVEGDIPGTKVKV